MIDNIFGTDGIRATVGTKPFTAELLQELGKAIAEWATKKYNKNPSILLGHDTRISSDIVKSALKSGLLLYPIQLFDGNILTSPAVSQLIALHNTFDCGIIISASHNPYQDNGIKVIDKYQGKLSLDDELIISYLFHSRTQNYSYHNLGKEIIWHDANELYATTFYKFFKANFLQGITVVLDCAHGAAYQIAPMLFEHFGATTIIVHDQPNGCNINDKCGALHPEELQKAVLKHGADIGFAFDGDADRVIVVTKDGHIKDGDDVLALLLQHPHYKETSHVVGTIMTNQGFELYLSHHQKTLIRTSVGDKYIAAQLQENNLLLGGEPSGHIIACDYLNTGDGIFIALRLLETIILTENWALETFVKFPQIIINVPIVYKKDLTITSLNQLIVNSRDALNNGRLIVRYSGTELLLRIMIEDNDYDHAHYIGGILAQQLSEALNN